VGRGFFAACRLIAAVAIGAALLVVAVPAGACGCGAVVTTDQLGVYDEAALVRHDGRTEDIVMRLAMTGEPADAAWILPVPSTPAFALGPEELFEDLVRATRPRVEKRRDWFPPIVIGGGGADTVGAPPGSGVSVIGQTKVGPYDVATLAATDGTALSRWLTSHGYTLDPELARGVQPYAAAGWQYVAVKLSAPSQGEKLGSTLPPLRVTFGSAEIVYPMRLTATADHGPSLKLFVLAAHRVEPAGSAASDAEVRFAGWVDHSTGPALGTLVDRRMFLTRFDEQVEPSQVTDDYRFRFAERDRTYRMVVVETEPMYVLFLPAGYALIFFGLFVSVFAVVLALRWRARRAARAAAG
jgi:hypothetical protein